MLKWMLSVKNPKLQLTLGLGEVGFLRVKRSGVEYRRKIFDFPRNRKVMTEKNYNLLENYLYY